MPHVIFTTKFSSNTPSCELSFFGSLEEKTLAELKEATHKALGAGQKGVAPSWITSPLSPLVS